MQDGFFSDEPREPSGRFSWKTKIRIWKTTLSENSLCSTPQKRARRILSPWSALLQCTRQDGHEFFRWRQSFSCPDQHFLGDRSFFRRPAKSTQILEVFLDLTGLRKNERSQRKMHAWRRKKTSTTGRTHRCAGTVSSNLARYSKGSKSAQLSSRV